ncbi:MAG TPA: ABC transporter permease [Geminicoccus sp.]|jgi:ribose transport system permease protein|uniref:ABC transporter permease n=1 Tax=Geminicoccus sp. TaxID=2024832 RepID=UPI002E31DBEF|nr:ABC transporter permease [Geminicoccus sp.]HEX2526316.1 ABC transporter permease [Geminicoccus sp.]
MQTFLGKATDTDWFGPLIVVVIAVAAIGSIEPSFLSSFNVQVLLSAIAVNLVIALAQMIIIALGQMNLSVGAIGGLVAIAFAGMMEVWGLPAPLALILALAIGTAAGLANGIIIARTGISAFIITLASLSFYKGVNLGITEAQPFYGIPEAVKAFGNTNMLGPIPWLVLPAAIAGLFIWYLLAKLRVGRQILAVGGNAHAAELSGISIVETTVWAHGLSGLLAALGGVMVVARLQIGQPSIGDDWLILSFAAPVIGGAVLAGGHVSVAGTALGVVVVAIITQSLVLFHIDPFVVQIVLGVLILWAVGINRWREVRVERRLRRA